MKIRGCLFILIFTINSASSAAQEPFFPVFNKIQLDSLLLLKRQFDLTLDLSNRNLYISNKERDSLEKQVKLLFKIRGKYAGKYYHVIDSIFNSLHQPCLAYTVYRLPQVDNWLGDDSLYIWDIGDYFLLPKCISMMNSFKYISVGYSFLYSDMCYYSDTGRFEYKKMSRAWHELNFDSARTVDLINLLIDSLPYGLRNARELMYLTIACPDFKNYYKPDLRGIKSSLNKTYGDGYFNFKKDFRIHLDTLPAYFSNFKKLKGLCLYSIDEIKDISAIENCDSLLFLAIVTDNINKTMIKSIAKMKNLKVLYLVSKEKKQTFSPEELNTLSKIQICYFNITNGYYQKLSETHPTWTLKKYSLFTDSFWFNSYQIIDEIPDE